MTIAAIDSGSIFRRLKEGEVVQEFDCGEAYEDLNDFIINDAHKDAAQFYKKNGFVELVETSHSLASDTTLMFYDLMALKQAI